MSTRAKVSIATWVVPVLLAILILGYVEVRHRQVMAEVAARPPVAIIPVDDLVVEALARNPGLSAQAEVIRIRQAGQRLAESGYVVLNARDVYGYPRDLEARP